MCEGRDENKKEVCYDHKKMAAVRLETALRNAQEVSGKELVQGPQDTSDPWRHRSEQMKCRTCMWFVQKTPSVGRCRRHAPTMNGYPAAYATDWCGDHKVDENKI